MRVCDRCGAAAVEEVVLEGDDQHFDLCESCRLELWAFLTTKPVILEPPAEDKKKRGSKGK